MGRTIMRTDILHDDNMEGGLVYVRPLKLEQAENPGDEALRVCLKIMIKILYFLEVYVSFIFFYRLKAKLVIVCVKQKLATLAPIEEGSLFDQGHIFMDVEGFEDIRLVLVV